ncbi:MAG TPA: Ig-like domain-containing protein [Gallionella sp.]|nr:Ig-like domain-containing protein [Gallionella sp.]
MSFARAWKTTTVFLLLITIPLGLGAAVLLSPLNTVPVPEPANLFKFVKDKQAAIRLGKALFWDMQVGSDGVTACASCHFHAGADNRNRNQLNPGLPAGDATFQAGATPGPDATLILPDFPLFKPANSDSRGTGGIDPNDPAVLRSINDPVSSQGVVLRSFAGVNAGQDVDAGSLIPDSVFSSNGNNLRRVEPRNAPTVINAVFNFTQFWDGRANHYFNGVNPFGNMDANASVWINQPAGLQPLNLTANGAANPYLLDNASLASQATGPALSDSEMSWRGRSWPDIGRKMLALQPLAKQGVHVRDSVLAGLRHPSGMGLSTTYTTMIQAAFLNELWDSPVPPPQSGTASYSQMESNFSLFFGLAVQLYQATLVSDNTPFDRFMAGDSTALTPRQQRGLARFATDAAGFATGGAGCAFCHAGAEFTVASVSMSKNPLEPGLLEIMTMGDGTLASYDLGFYNIGVRPTGEDIGRGGVTGGLPDLQGNPLPLSFARQFLLHQQGMLPFPAVAQPNCLNEFNAVLPTICPPNLLAVSRVAVDGAFKTPGLRNVELTGPYMHNGSMATLMQVVEFYTRGGNFREANMANLDLGILDINILKNDLEKKREMVDFLLALTDERVRWEQAPFDHPQLFVPHGHGNAMPTEPVLADLMIEIPAVGDAGRQAEGLPPLKPFLADNLQGAELANFHFQPTIMNGTPPVIASTPPAIATQGKSYAYKVTASDAEGGPLAFTLDQAPAGMTIKATSGFVAWVGWTPANSQVGTQNVTVRASDPTGLFTVQSFSIAVANVNDAPLVRNDAYTMIKGGTLTVAAPGVLANDIDPDVGDTLTAPSFGTPRVGTLIGNLDGSFSYTPPATYTGMASFSYLARDSAGLVSKNAGVVSIAVKANRAPVAVADTVSTLANTPLVIDVLGNDSDPDTAIDPSNKINPPTVFIPVGKQPDMGGKVTVNADGTIGYTPKPGFIGTETFMYAVRDTYITPAISRAVSVRVNVQ